jgi:hypothetical protein
LSRKGKKSKLKKKLEKSYPLQKNKVSDILIEWDRFNPDKYLPYIAESGIILNSEQKAEYQQKTMPSRIVCKGEAFQRGIL